MKIELSQRDIQDAIIVATESRYIIDRAHLTAELFYAEDRGFHAQAHVRTTRRVVPYDLEGMVNAVAVFLEQEHNFDPALMNVEFFFSPEEGFSASVVMDGH